MAVNRTWYNSILQKLQQYTDSQEKIGTRQQETEKWGSGMHLSFYSWVSKRRKEFRAELQLVTIPTSAPQMLSMLNVCPDTGGNKGAEAEKARRGIFGRNNESKRDKVEAAFDACQYVCLFALRPFILLALLMAGMLVAIRVDLDAPRGSNGQCALIWMVCFCSGLWSNEDASVWSSRPQLGQRWSWPAKSSSPRPRYSRRNGNSWVDFREGRKTNSLQFLFLLFLSPQFSHGLVRVINGLLNLHNLS